MTLFAHASTQEQQQQMQMQLAESPKNQIVAAVIE